MTELTDKHFEDFGYIILAIERGEALRNAVKGLMSKSTFYQIVDSDIKYENQYARACEDREENIFEDILVIADDTSYDKFVDDNGIERTDNEAIQRSRLRIDARKWMLGKMRPKKYGDKLNVDQKTELSFPKIDMNEWK